MFIMVKDKPLLPSYVILTIGLYMKLSNTIGFNSTKATIYSLNYAVSAKRIGEFLLSKELDRKTVPEPELHTDDKVAVEIKDFSFARATGFSLNNISLTINKGISCFVGYRQSAFY